MSGFDTFITVFITQLRVNVTSRSPKETGSNPAETDRKVRNGENVRNVPECERMWDLGLFYLRS